MEKKKDNDSSIDAEFLTADGVARYMHISRMSVYNLINNDDTFPKGHPILSSKKRKVRRMHEYICRTNSRKLATTT